MSNYIILTFHNAINYGAVLQCYALLKTVNRIKGAASVLNYKNVRIEKNRKLFQGLNISTVKSFLTIVKNVKLHRNFNRFLQNEIQLTNNTRPEDILIVGSDQVWNNNCTDTDLTFFGKGLTCKKKYSYAASFGGNEDLINEYEIKLLAEFDRLSVRENNSQNFLLLKGLQSVVNLDPVFLLSVEEWKRLANKRPLQKLPKDFILLFSLMNSNELNYEAKRVSEEKGLSLVIISFALRKTINNAIYITPDIYSWLYLINNASVVFTNSFHGFAFSLIFNKEYHYSSSSSSQLSVRMKSMEEILQLPSMDISNHKSIEQRINYSEVNKLLAEERKRSFHYIESM